jgi:Protein of unknown function (DUF2742)
MNGIASQQVSWESVRDLIGPILNQVNGWPTAGTPAWCSLAHEDPRKWCAVLDMAQRWALQLELGQQAKADASKAVSAAVDWKAVAREIQQRHGVYIPRRATS